MEYRALYYEPSGLCMTGAGAWLHCCSADTFNSRQLFVSLCFTVGGNGYYTFGSGTKLYVTDEPVAKPVASVYPAAPRARLEGRSALLCQASAMFPPVVRFSWKRRKENGPLEEPPPAETEQLELRESGRAAAILLIHQPENSTFNYICYVQHEGGKAEAPPVPGNEGSVSVLSSDGASCGDAVTESRGAEDGHFSLLLQTFDSFSVSEAPAPAASRPPEREPTDLPAVQQADLSVSVSFQSQCRVKLLLLLYSVLIVKSLVYCCGLSLLMILRNKGPSTNCTHAD
ncbi:uncharacterized protein LOC121614938 [Chelmon rostratus]|uniref:uncharacterized protein LOC121614938 n=1 Tax=Chelmon rostratus TaxID=109905 RepID=UPI001BECE8ED|nr:uncharacterized protein LOC121614938 [Chelmon rostratus]